MASITHRHSSFYHCAIKHCYQADKKSRKLMNKISDLKFIDKFKKVKLIQTYLTKRILKLNLELREHIDVSICMSAFTLESFINFYGAVYKVKESTNYEEKKAYYTRDKWKMYPQYRNKGSLDQKTLDLVQKVLNDRNEIAHFKPQVDVPNFTSHTLSVAFENLNNIHEIIEEFKKIDTSITFETSLYNVPKYSYRNTLEFLAIVK